MASGAEGPRYDARQHVAFHGRRPGHRRRFHEAALAAGARSLRGPGVWVGYHPHYYGAFVAGPDGVNVEAVCHR